VAKWAMVSWAFLCMGALAAPRKLLPNLSHLTPQILERLEQSLASENDEHYQTLLHAHTLSELRTLYAADNSSRVETVYASFAADLPGFHASDDEGFGLHVVKRLKVADRTLLVNEHWPIDRETGGLLLPDEIRVQSQVFQGEARVPGSQDTYLFDSLRMAWGPDGEIEIFRRAHVKDHMRVPVIAPRSCLNCHATDMSGSFAADFLESGEARNFETIVSDSHFALPYQKQRGLRQYLDFLKARHGSPEFLSAVQQRLERPNENLNLPGILPALNRSSVQFLGDDLPWNRSSYSSLHQAYGQQGTYLTEQGWYLDALEDIFEGKYRWWTPRIVVP